MRKLSRNEMKNVMGGLLPYSMACTCNSGSGGTIVCGFSGLTGQDRCMTNVRNFCVANGGTNTGGGYASCTIGAQQ
jgi:hypothetical protein